MKHNCGQGVPLPKAEHKDWLLDKYHANLLESGKINRRLTWTIFVVGAFFVYLAVTYANQPKSFTISLAGQLQIQKRHLILCAPFLIGTLNLASIVSYLYAASLHAKLREMIFGNRAGSANIQEDVDYLNYPSFETVLLNISSGGAIGGATKYLLKSLYWLYRVIVRGLPYLLQGY